jgi:hypothetical protein
MSDLLIKSLKIYKNLIIFLFVLSFFSAQLCFVCNILGYSVFFFFFFFLFSLSQTKYFHTLDVQRRANFLFTYFNKFCEIEGACLGSILFLIIF